MNKHELHHISGITIQWWVGRSSNLCYNSHMKRQKEQILALRAEGKTYNEIHRITGASKGTISYHCATEQTRLPPRPVSECKFCGNDFKLNKESSKFCSRQCWKDFNDLERNVIRSADGLVLSKLCSECSTDKDGSEFPLLTDGRISTYCKGCTSKRAYEWLRASDERYSSTLLKAKARKYKVSAEQLTELYDQSNGLCAICEKSPDLKDLVVDHCHASGEVRGIICRSCNVALGMMRDDPTTLRLAANYLEDYNMKHTHSQ